MHARVAFQECHQAGQHRSSHTNVRKPLPRSGRVASYYIVLKFFKMIVLYSPLSHRPETGIDAVNDFVFREFFQKLVTVSHLTAQLFRNADSFAMVKDLFYLGQRQTLIDFDHFIVI